MNSDALTEFIIGAAIEERHVLGPGLLKSISIVCRSGLAGVHFSVISVSSVADCPSSIACRKSASACCWSPRACQARARRRKCVAAEPSCLAITVVWLLMIASRCRRSHVDRRLVAAQRRTAATNTAGTAPPAPIARPSRPNRPRGVQRSIGYWRIRAGRKA